MKTNVISIVKAHIVGEIFSESPTLENQHPFDFFMSSDIDSANFVGDSALGEEWGFQTHGQYDYENIKSLRSLMQSMLDDLLKLQASIIKNCTTEVKLSLQSFSSSVEFYDLAEIVKTKISSGNYITFKTINIEDNELDDVTEVDERVSCNLNLTAFEIARYGNDELYNMAVAKFNEVGLNLEILDMEMIPTKIEEHFVSYDCIPTEYKRIFTDNDVWHMKNGVRLNTEGE